MSVDCLHIVASNDDDDVNADDNVIP